MPLRAQRWIGAGLAVVLAVTMADWVVARPAAAAPEPAPAPAAPQTLERPDEAAAVQTARLTGKKVRISGMTSETSEFWALPDGRVEAEVHLGPVRMRDDSGGWQQVDFNLVRQADGSVRAKAHPNGLRLSGAAGAGEHDLVTVGRADDELSLGWSGALPEPEVDGVRATYPEVRPGVDLVVESTRTGFEQFLVVKNRSAVAQVRSIALPLRGKGLKAVADDRGGFEIRDAGGETVGASPEPLMWDARVDPRSGERLRQTRVGKKVGAAKGGRLAVTLTPDEAWLTDKATTFPVTIDPAVTLKPNYDAFVQIGFTSDQSAATELKVGTYDGGTTKARSFLSFHNMEWLQGKQVQAATLYLWNHHSWSCTARQWETWQTSYVTTSARWTNQPTWMRLLGYTTATKGYNSSCAAGRVNASVTGAFADQANGVTCCSTVNIGLRAASETDNLGWKRFHSMEGANDPYVTLTYQTPPTVTARATVPSLACATNPNTPYVNTKTPQLRAQITDAEGSQVRAEFEWLTGGGTRIGGTTVGPAASGSWLTATVPAGAFAEGSTYSWRVRGNDGSANGPWTGYCAMIIDTVGPSAMPTVSSTAYPAGQWAGAVGTAGSFTFGASGVGDVTAYEYGLNVDAPSQTVNAPSLGANATVSITPTVDGPQTLYVRSRDRAGNRSAIRSYTFNVGSGAVTAPKEGDITAAKTAITGIGQAAATGVTYQWRRGDADAWVNIPTGHVTVAAGGGAVTWPLPTSGGGNFAKLNWDVEATLAAADAASIPRSGPLQLRGTFTGGTGGTSSAVKITFDRDQASAASQQVGPGSVNLITGNYTLADTDVSVSSFGSDLTVTRSYNTRRAAETDAANMFGPGWVSGTVVEEAEAPYTSLTVFGSLVQVGLPEGETIGFTKRTATAFDPEIGMEFLKLVYASGSDSYTLTDGDGNIVVFSRVAGTAAGKYFPTSVTAPGDTESTTLSWEKTTIAGKEIVRPTRMLAPVAAGVDCTTLVKGCRALTFTYASTATATGTGESQWGDYPGRVKEIAFTAWDPEATPAAMRTVAMARYAYDNAGRLRAAWDPGLDWSDEGGVRHLWSRYAYDGDGIINTVTPAAEEPWQLSYTTLPDDPGKGRLKATSRSALNAGTATTTVVYGVPTSGAGAPYDLSGAQTARWYQNEAPTDATAVFPVTQLPGGNQAAGTMPTSWERALVIYMDANAREVNSAEPGGHIATTWYDQWGHVTRELTAGNRKRALDASPTDNASQEAELARDRSTLNEYSGDGQRLTATWEPGHEVMLADGSVERGRPYTTYTYDEGAPGTGGPYNLLTTEVQQLRVWDNNIGGWVTHDPRTTKTQYDWTLRQPTATIVDPAGLALTTRTRYDASGAVVATTAPGGGGTETTPSTQVVVYYTGTPNSAFPECGSRLEWAGLVCRTHAGGQAATGPQVPARVLTYDMFGLLRTAVEKTTTGVLRTTTITYDSGYRPRETRVEAPGLGEPVSTTRNVYDVATGQPVRTQSITPGGAVAAQVIRGYDTLGRMISYTDADGNVSTVVFDVANRPTSVSDGRATRTITYDTGGERRGLPTAATDSQAGQFTATYDADGALVGENWPNGVQITIGNNESGTPASINYTQPGCGQDDCTLYTEARWGDAHGRIVRRTSTLSGQSYSYDRADRLRSTADTIGGQCTTRTYAFSSATNRTGMVSYGWGADGVCQTDSVSATRSWTYDAADRVNSAGYSYDALGRTLTMPAADSAIADGGDLQLGYHVNDMAHTIIQGTRSATYTLDVINNRFRSWHDTDSGVTRRHHYSGDGDSPAWTDEGDNTISRPIVGLSGIAGVFSTAGGLVWHLTNLHGDFVAGMTETEPGLAYTSEQAEYGQPRDADDAGSRRYGWLGSARRAADTPGGLVLMGARLYVSGTGRFLSTDPVVGGSCNDYEYGCGDPVNNIDVTGCNVCKVSMRSTSKSWPWWRSARNGDRVTGKWVHLSTTAWQVGSWRNRQDILDRQPWRFIFYWAGKLVKVKALYHQDRWQTVRRARCMLIMSGGKWYAWYEVWSEKRRQWRDRWVYDVSGLWTFSETSVWMNRSSINTYQRSRWYAGW
ncbi:RHS repeat-associated core domain-containing protein [Micromonospora sp. CA-263727]|uniref:RHS repeat-associated core domain-containing protein n=1 Tax=Micromonospora sp. CA-263727 TaxID=3239967 RepID=UPI003D8D85CA